MGMKVIDRFSRQCLAHLNAARRGTLAALVLLSAGLLSCVPDKQAPVKIKVLSLNPEEYFGTQIQLKGKVVALGPAEAYWVVEDETGRVLVGTERIARKMGCQSQSQVELEGTLLKLKSVSQPYFSMKKLISCIP
ncbi:MAG: hypothetical protein RIR26_1146 [Pseudomonadota bacterium]